MFHIIRDLSANFMSAGKDPETLEHSRKLVCLNGWGQHDKIIISRKVSALRLCPIVSCKVQAALLILTQIWEQNIFIYIL